MNFTEQDIQQIEARGLTLEKINTQLTIFKEGENIFAQITNRIKVELTAVNENTFDVFDYGIRIVFNMDENQNISELTILSNGERKAKKIE